MTEFFASLIAIVAIPVGLYLGFYFLKYGIQRLVKITNKPAKHLVVLNGMLTIMERNFSDFSMNYSFMVTALYVLYPMSVASGDMPTDPHLPGLLVLMLAPVIYGTCVAADCLSFFTEYWLKRREL